MKQILRSQRVTTAQIILIGTILAIPLGGIGAEPNARSEIPSIMVTGRGEAFSKPDEATVRLGVTAQMENAADAQREVNRLMDEVIKKIRALGIADEKIRTVGLNLSPVYGPMRRDVDRDERLIGYRAANIVEVQVAKLDLIGPVIDQAIGAGANRVEGISFDVADDQELREVALRRAIGEATQKARVMAEAADVEIGELLHMSEGGVRLVQPQLEMGARMSLAMDATTPVQPGQVRVETSVTMRFRIAEAD